MTGYLHPDYAQSLAEFGTPRLLPRSGGWVLERQIPGFIDRDAMGCYPRFFCEDWSQLTYDLEDIGDDLVSVALVTEAFGEYDENYLFQCFKDVVIPFKQHVIIDLSRPLHNVVSTHNYRYAKKALKQLHVERCDNPATIVHDWIKLYDVLIDRHKIKGISAFSKSSFEKQLNIPGIEAFRSMYEGRTVGILLWYVQNKAGYYHLGASSQLGYDLRSSFALFWYSITYFAAKGLRWLDIGAEAGLSKSSDGLQRFKRGWSTESRTVYFCGRILNRTRYADIVKANGLSDIDYFPAYRKGEFG